jgi:hypothetical protein
MSVTVTEKTGIISEFYDVDSGLIIEDETGKEFDFVRKGAQVNFLNNEKVIFVTITTPRGKEIVKEIVKNNN